VSAAQPTRASLLLRIRNAEDQAAWATFVDIYTPLVWTFCRRHGLQDADAADVSQEVMLAVASAIRRFEYDPERGSFRSWMATVTRSKLNNFFLAQQRHPIPVGDSELAQACADTPSPNESAEWDRDYRQRVFDWAAARVRPEVEERTWQAFWRTAIEREDGKTVAESLGLSVGAVYVARSRVLARLKEEVQAVDEQSMIAAVV
jgi:RNA polymerase sigma-70 factor (ECF subfamily)